MTRTTDTITAIEADEHSRHTGALRDDDLDCVSGGEVYMHNPRGSASRISHSPTQGLR